MNTALMVADTPLVAMIDVDLLVSRAMATDILQDAAK
jgi:hypothetical protein